MENGKSEQEAVEPTRPSRFKIQMDKAPPESHREYLDMDTDEEEFGRQETPEPVDEAPPEPDKPVFTTEELEKLVNYTKDLTVLPDFNDSDWNADCLETIREYFRDPTKVILTIFFDRSRLCALLDFPETTDSGMTYFLRDPWEVYRADNFMSTVKFGTVSERAEKTMLKLVEGTYAPLVFNNPNWAKIKRDEIFSNLNDFLTQAMEMTYKPMGMLLLYVPWEATHTNQEEKSLAAVSKQCITQSGNQDERQELINRLEKVARTWIKQIRAALKASPFLTEELHDVSSEFDFWLGKYENLERILKQLKSSRALAMIKQLKSTNSITVMDLKLLHAKIKKGLEETKSNLTCLDVIIENCEAFNDPKQIEDCMPRILHIMRFVWDESPYYNKPDNIQRLISCLSVLVVKTCIKSIDLKLVFEDPKKCRETLEICISGCDSYSKIYDNIIANCLKNEEKWKVKKDIAFNCITAFKQRCQDVSEICDAIIIYGGLNKINFGGTRGNQHEMQYRQAMEYFLLIIDEMRVCCSYALDITEFKWFGDMARFRSNVAELENTIKNLINNVFDDVRNVETGIETLYTLLKFKERRGFQEILQDKWTQVWEIFAEEIKICILASKEYDVVQDELRLSQSKKSLMPQITKKYLTRLHKMMINASDWLGDCDVQFEAPLQYFKQKVRTEAT